MSPRSTALSDWCQRCGHHKDRHIDLADCCGLQVAGPGDFDGGDFVPCRCLRFEPLRSEHS